MTHSIVASNLAKPSPKVVKSFNDRYRFKRFNRLIPLLPVGMDKNHRLIIIAACDCGELVQTMMQSIKTGGTKSCGCIQNTRSIPGHPLYHVLSSIIERTTKPKCPSYKNYGGRGIAICDEWKNSYEAFLKWGIENGWAQGLDIDRIDNDGNYSPENCRFVTRRANCQNRRVSRYCNWNGEIISFATACERLGVTSCYMSGIEIRKAYHLLPSFVKIIPRSYDS